MSTTVLGIVSRNFIRCQRSVVSRRTSAAVLNNNGALATTTNISSVVRHSSLSTPYEEGRSSGGGKDDGKGGFILRGTMGALAAGTLIGVATAYYYRLENEKKLARLRHQKGTKGEGNLDFHKLTPEYPEEGVPHSRRIRTAEDRTGLKLTLFQFQNCPFCCKVRAFLDYHGLNYDIVEVNSIRRNEIKWSPYRKVPILVATAPGGNQYQLNDSTFIISILRSWLMSESKKSMEDLLKFYPVNSYTDENGKEKLETMNKYYLMFEEEKLPDIYANTKEVTEERKWRKWVDDVFVHTLSPNIYRNPSEAYQAFKIFDFTGEWEKHFSVFERYTIIYLGAFVMWIVGKRLKKRHNLSNDVRADLYEQTNKWLSALKKKKTPFMGGNEPNMADVSFFGALNSIEGCIAFLDLFKNTEIKKWYDSMRYAVGYRHGRDYTIKRSTSLPL